jgi:hypothetical protein
VAEQALPVAASLAGQRVTLHIVTVEPLSPIISATDMAVAPCFEEDTKA